MVLHKPVVLITGSGGRLGKAITAGLADSYTVVGFERHCADLPDCLEVDLTSAQALDQACARLATQYGTRIASVIHLAAFYDFSGAPNPLYEKLNVEATRMLLHALRDFEVGQFVYASTMLVHAPCAPGQPLTERAPLKPSWPYPQSKLAAEQVIADEHGMVPAVVLRLAGVYTDDAELPGLAQQIVRIYERQQLGHVFPGEPSHGQAMVHIDDVVEAFRSTIERRAHLPPLTELLIGEPVTESYLALQNMIGQLLHGEPWSTRQIPKSVAAAGAWLQHRIEDIVPDAIDRGIEPFVTPFMIGLADEHYEIDTASAEALLGWRARHSVRRRLPTILGKLQQDPQAWYRRNKVAMPVWLEEAPEAGGAGGRVIAQYHERDRIEHQRTLWCHFANIALGLWLITSPFIFGLAQSWMEPGELTAPNQRGWVYSSTLMTASDILTGILIVVFGTLSLSRDAGWARWVTAALGIWLLLAPIAFWTTSAAAYANDTLIGALVVLFAVALPTAPGINPLARVAGPDAPPGWDYSPSGITNRLPIIALAFIGLFVSRYLAAYQLGHIPAAWDPLFGAGTEIIVTSAVSEAWPVSDAGLGGMVYVLEILTGAIGDKRRWRSMPWLVLVFGILIVPLGVISIYFIVIQPIVIGTWCTLCLFAALAMLLQIPYSFDEILATLQFLKARRRVGMPLWYVLMRGDTMEGGNPDYSDNFSAPPGALLREMLFTGVSVPWTMLASLLIGVALMSSRWLFDASGTAANSDHIAGSMVVAFSIMAWAEVARPLRFVNAAIGLWLVAAPWVLAPFQGSASASVLFGVALIALAWPAGRFTSHFGAWDKVARAGPQRLVPGHA